MSSSGLWMRHPPGNLLSALPSAFDMSTFSRQYDILQKQRSAQAQGILAPSRCASAPRRTVTGSNQHLGGHVGIGQCRCFGHHRGCVCVRGRLLLHRSRRRAELLCASISGNLPESFATSALPQSRSSASVMRTQRMRTFRRCGGNGAESAGAVIGQHCTGFARTRKAAFQARCSLDLWRGHRDRSSTRNDPRVEGALL